MTSKTARRRIAFTVLFALASCNVYDSSLLVGGGGSTSGGGGGSGSGGSNTGGTDAEDAGAGNGGSAGTPTNGGSGGGGGVSGTTNGGTENMGGEPPVIGGEGGMNDGGAGSGGGGTGGTTGGAGMGGGGAGGRGGTGGTSGGSAGTGGSGGSTSATGCAKLSVPLDGSSDKAHFLITLNSTQDLTTGTIVLRFYVEAGKAGSILPYVQDPNFAFFGRTPADLTTFNGWSTITWDVGAQTTTGNINKSMVKRVGVEITASPISAGWSNPTVVYLDSITVKTTAFPFDTTATVSMSAGSSDQSNQVLWLNSGSSDTTAGGVAVSWQATCP